MRRCSDLLVPFLFVDYRGALTLLALILGACCSRQTGAQNQDVEASSREVGADGPTERDAIFDEVKPDKSDAPLSRKEVRRLDEIAAAASGESAPFSECQRRISLGLWSDRLKRHQEHPSEEALEKLEQGQGSEPAVIEILARENFRLSQAALRDLLVDELKSDERKPARTRSLLADWERLNNRAGAFLARAAGLKLRKSPEYAYQLALLKTQDAEWEDANQQLRTLVVQKEASPALASRSYLLLGIVQLTLTPKEPERVLPPFVSVATSGVASDDPIVLSSYCYRAEIAAMEGNRAEAALLFQKIRDARDSSGLSRWAEQRLEFLGDIEKR
jgi:hypothetical protein